MGHIVKKILGDHEPNPEYKGLIIEFNADERVHIHSDRLRIDMNKSAYNTFHDAVIASLEHLERKHGWKKQ